MYARAHDNNLKVVAPRVRRRVRDGYIVYECVCVCVCVLMDKIYYSDYRVSKRIKSKMIVVRGP